MMKMFVFSLVVQPLPSNSEFGRTTGGIAYLYVYDSDTKKAAERAVQNLKSNAWNIVKFDEGGEAMEGNCTTDDQKTLFAQAKLNGLSCLVVLDPIGSPRFN